MLARRHTQQCDDVGSFAASARGGLHELGRTTVNLEPRLSSL